MIRILGILCLALLLASCSYFSSYKNQSKDKIARCEELKHDIIFTQSSTAIDPLNPNTNTNMIAAQQSAELDNLNREYRENGCT